MSLVLIVIIVFYSPSELLAKNTSACSKNSNIINGDMQLSEVSSSEFKRYKIVQTRFYKIDGNSVKTKSKKYLM